jgi:methionyl-tRNA formyltransferase
MALRLAFMGTPEFSVQMLNGLWGSEHEIAAVFTQPPRPAGRGMNAQLSPVHTRALELGLPVNTPRTLKDNNEQKSFARLELDCAIIVAYGLLLPPAIFNSPTHGCLNLHPSLLPRWRGAAPIQRTLMAGDAETGVIVMRMDEGLDTGHVCLTEKILVAQDMTAGMLHDILSRNGTRLMLAALDQLQSGTLQCTAQSDLGVTYAAKINKAECRIDIQRPANVIHNHIRALSPYPGAWLEIKAGPKPGRLKILKSRVVVLKTPSSNSPGTLIDGDFSLACGNHAIQFEIVQPAGKSAMTGTEFIRGARINPGTKIV